MKGRLILVFSLLMTALIGCGPKAGIGFSEADLLLNVGGNAYRCGTRIETIIDALGDDYAYSEGKSCAYDGLDKTFAYETAQFFTNPLDAGDTVSEIYTESPAVSTSKGITVESSKADVLKAYGEEGEDGGNLLIYRLPDARGALCFEMEHDRVIAIFVTTEAI